MDRSRITGAGRKKVGGPHSSGKHESPKDRTRDPTVDRAHSRSGPASGQAQRPDRPSGRADPAAGQTQRPGRPGVLSGSVPDPLQSPIRSGLRSDPRTIELGAHGDPSAPGLFAPGPSMQSPSTQSPLTQSPSTQSPSTSGPSTQSPSTSGPSTQSPSTQSPSTQSPPEAPAQYFRTTPITTPRISTSSTMIGLMVELAG